MTQAGHQHGVPFREGYVEADGLRIRYLEGGRGEPVVLLCGASGLEPSPLGDLLAERNRLVALDLPDLSDPSATVAGQSIPDFARTVQMATGRLELGQYGLVSFGAGAHIALQVALDARERVTSLVLISPLVIVPKQESRLDEVSTPTLVVFGTRDELIPREMGRVYKERMPNSFLVFVYDAGHAIAAERPEALAGVVSDFLERRETFIVSQVNTMINP
jgi:pimeloyl-ACP methyl ester carboxylesterase